MKTKANSVHKIKDIIFEKQIHWNNKTEDYFRNLSLRSRLIFIACMFLIMSFVFIGMMVVTIIQLEKNKIQKIELEHIRGMDLNFKSDTINLNKNYDYEREN